MKTLAVMCIALISASPSRTPLSSTAASTWGVMFTKSIRAGTLKVRTWRWDFMECFGRHPLLQHVRLHLHPLHVSSETKLGWLVLAHKLDVGLFRNFVLHSQGPVSRADQHAASPFRFQVGGGSHGGAEDAGGF